MDVHITPFNIGYVFLFCLNMLYTEKPTFDGRDDASFSAIIFEAILVKMVRLPRHKT